MAIDFDGASFSVEPGITPEEWFDRQFARKLSEHQASKRPRLSMLVSKGTLDWAYVTFIISSTAAAMDWDVSVFFTFYGLGLLKKELDPDISPLGNPAMPMKMPFGPNWFRDVEWNIPNLVMAGIPGFEKAATGLMKRTLEQKGVAPIQALRELSIEAGVELIACQMTVDLFSWKKEDFIPGISDWAGAATYLTKAQGADVSLFI